MRAIREQLKRKILGERERLAVDLCAQKFTGQWADYKVDTDTLQN